MKRLILFFIAAATLAATAQTEQIRRVTVDSVLINETAFYPEEFDKLFIASSDSITFYYSVRVKKQADRTPFMFSTKLKKSGDSSVTTTGSPVVRFKNLPEDQYVFEVAAFDLKRKWNAGPVAVRFESNNRAAKLRNDLAKSENENIILENKLENISPSKTEFEIFGFEASAIILGLFFGVALSGAATFLIMNNANNKKSKKHKGAQMNEKNLSPAEREKLLAENSNLKAEIAALRGQIDAMQARSEELKKQNKELEKKIALLSKSKGEVEELSRQKDELFAVIIHDIKNPAALIKSLVELLRSYDLNATEQQEVINDILATTSRIVSLSQEVSKILALEGQLKLDIISSNVNDLVQDVYHNNKIASDKKQLKMYLELQEDLPNCEMDYQKIEEVIDNLVSNAIKFTQNGGTIRMKTELKENAVRTHISDNGLGLSSDDVKNAFQRGAKLSAQPTGDESSTGLGLWIVKKLVEAHNGRVWIKSALGKGSTFSFSVPLKHENNKSEKE